MRNLTVLLASILFPVLSQADTLVVDDDGGPGVDFTSIVDAVAAANRGDMISVHDGLYPAYITLDQALRIESAAGSTSVVISSFVMKIRDIPAGDEVHLRGLEFVRLEIDDCEGSVFISEVRAGGIAMNHCANVRVADSEIWGVRGCPWDYACYPAASVSSSYAEFLRCDLRGDSDFEGEFGYDGQSGLVVGPASIVHCIRSTAVGGFGGRNYCVGGGDGVGGNGGHGVHVMPGGQLFLRLDPGAALGSGGSWEQGCNGDGVRGYEMLNEGFVQFVGVTPADLDLAGAGEQEVVPLAPYVEGSITSELVTLTVHGRPGAAVHILVARQPALESLPTILEPLLVDPIRVMSIGVLPESGSFVLSAPLPPAMPPGSRFALQALVTDEFGRRLTNSVIYQIP